MTLAGLDIEPRLDHDSEPKSGKKSNSATNPPIGLG